MVLGILIAAFAFFIFILFGRNGGTTSNQGTRNINVVVAAVDIPAGQQISDQLVRIETFAPEQVPAGAFNKIKDVTGQYAAVALTKNSALSSSTLVTTLSKLPPVKKPYLDIPAGQVAISIPGGGELQQIGGFIQPDDRVDILWSPDGTTWQVTFQNLRISHVGPFNSSNVQGISSSFVVFVSVDDAETLSVLFGTGAYKFVLRSQADAEKNDTVSSGGTNLQQFKSRFHVPS